MSIPRAYQNVRNRGGVFTRSIVKGDGEAIEDLSLMQGAPPPEQLHKGIGFGPLDRIRENIHGDPVWADDPSRNQ